jgi:hypothetical protein
LRLSLLQASPFFTNRFLSCDPNIPLTILV